MTFDEQSQSTGDPSGDGRANDWEHILSSLDAASLRKAAADNEPGAEDALNQLSQDREADHREVQNETALRHAVGRVMGAQTAPEHLRLSVIQALAGEATDEAAPIPFSTVESKAPAGFTGVLARIGRPLAAAAVLGLGAIAVFQAVNTANPSGGQVASVIPTSQLQELTNYLTGRHVGAMSGTVEGVQLNATDALSRVQAALGELTPALSQGVTTLAEAGYMVKVVKVCQVPNSITSAHIMLTPPSGAASPDPVSVFIQSHGTNADTCLLKKIDSESCYVCPEAKLAGDTFAFWRDGGFVLHVMSQSNDSFEQMMSVLGAPQSRIDIR